MSWHYVIICVLVVGLLAWSMRRVAPLAVELRTEKKRREAAFRKQLLHDSFDDFEVQINRKGNNVSG